MFDVCRATLQQLTLGYLTLATSPDETIEAAAANEFSSCGLRLTPRSVLGRQAADDLRDANPARLARHARDAGVRISNVTCYQINAAMQSDTMARVIQAASILGVSTVVINAFDVTLEQALDQFGNYCHLAEDAGVRMALEFIPYSAVRTLNEALYCVRSAASPAACLTIDLLHLCRSGNKVAELVGICPDEIGLYQICDAPLIPRDNDFDTLKAEAREGRLPLGDGALPIMDFLGSLHSSIDVEYEIPMLSNALRSAVAKASSARANIEAFIHNQMSHQEGN